jgi:type II secretory pathway component GspD/PulD (secretin)
MQFKLLPLTLASVGVLSGCALTDLKKPTTLETSTLSTAVKRQENTSLKNIGNMVEDTDQVYIPVKKVMVKKSSQWLKNIKITMDVAPGTPLPELLKGLAGNGINITSGLPLDSYVYQSGYPLKGLDAETAIRAILTDVGLDYTVDSSRKLITIRPISSKTWNITTGSRKTTYTSGITPITSSGSMAKTGSSSSGSSSSSSSASEKTAGSGVSTVSSGDDFWTALKEELDKRLTILVPKVNTPASATATTSAPALATAVPSVPGLPGSLQTAAPVAPIPQVPALTTVKSDTEMVERKVGTYAINPATGAVTVSAPSWMLEELDTYFANVRKMYNTELSFQGEVVMLTTTQEKSEGLDVASFAQFASKRYGLLVKNNGLGGVTLSSTPGSLIPNVATGPNVLSGSTLGLVSAADGLQIFNAYFSTLGKVTSIQKPIITTTSGVPGDFRKLTTRYYNTVSQDAGSASSSGTGNASAVATKNEIVAQDYGTVLRVYPTVDMLTGLVRVQIELVQTLTAGTTTLRQTVAAGNTVTQVDSPIGNVTRIVYQGEALLKDGDVVVAGGQTDEAETGDKNGVTGLSDNIGGAIFGKTNQTSSKNLYYFTLKVKVNPRQ